ncbi:MAG: UDP-N-acetylmuramoyl-L-alanine--D-glutamate ligase [Meiothermus sp.]
MSRKLVYGLGRSGLGVLGYLHRHAMTAHFYDDHLKPEDVQKALALGFQPDISPKPGVYHEVIAAPGVPIDHPNLVALREGGAEIMGEAELVYRTSKTPLIGITGTAGKTSCTMFTAHFLQALGFGAVAGGNIDPPLASVVDDAEVVAVELSSFQLERVVHFRPRVAVLLMLGVDHLDRHHTVEAYHAAKFNLIKNLTDEDALVYNARDRKIVAGIANSPAKRYSFEPADNPRETNLRAAEQAAIAYAELVGKTVSREALRKAWDSAPKPEGRFELFARIGNVAFIDDSIATRIDSVRMALEAAPAPVAWILGGVDKGAPVEELKPVVERKVRLILAVGKDGSRMADPFRSVTEVVDITEADGRKALERAVQESLHRLRTGSVLLAPLATSFDQFKDYKERSKVFREAVHHAKKGQGMK